MAAETKLADLCPGETEERMEFSTRLSKLSLDERYHNLALTSYNCGFSALSRIIMKGIDSGVLELTVFDKGGNPFKVNKAK